MTATFLPDARKLFIDGRWLTPESSTTDAVINPATEELLVEVPSASRNDLAKALHAARRAFDDGPWPRLHREERARIVQRALDIFTTKAESILQLMTLEMGYTRPQGAFLLGLGSAVCNRFVEIARRDPVRPLPMLISPNPYGGKNLGSAVVARDPIGVVAAITPYNAGFLLGLVKSVPALLAGNTLVLKPSPYTPLQSFLIAHVMAELDLPPGVFNLITGDAEVSAALTSDSAVDMVTFTGSDVVGARVMAQAAPTLKKVHLELGGKSPLVIRHDADLDIAVQAGLFGFAHQCGQGCSMTTRHIVDNKIRPQYVERLVAATQALKVGDPADRATDVGPLIREVARARTEKYVELALAEGAKLVFGGKRPASLSKGFFHEPTIFDDVDNRSRLAQEEVFGPIAAVVGYDSGDEAIKLANDTRYGLGGAIVSRDTGTAMEMSLKMRTGMIMINGGPGGFHPDMPFGGYKRSGIGREWGEEGFNEFTQLKSIGFSAR